MKRVCVTASPPSWQLSLDPRNVLKSIKDVRFGEKAYSSGTWLRLAQRCGNRGFEPFGKGEFQLAAGNTPGSSVKAEKIYELNDGNILVMLPSWSVVKINLKYKEVDSDFQRNLIDAIRQRHAKGEKEASKRNDWGDIRFGMPTSEWLIFHSYKEMPKIIVTDLDGVKLFEADNF